MYVEKVRENVILILLCWIATSHFVHALEQHESRVKNFDRPKVITSSPKIFVDAKKIAREKCIEYAAYRFINKTLESPLIDDSPSLHTIRDCKKIDQLIIERVENAVENEFPHMAAIGFGEQISNIQWICGGFLISEQYILSAAHCVTAQMVVEWALLGQLSTQSVNEGKLNKNVFRIVTRFVHPNYRPPIGNNDIAILKLEKPLVLRPTIRPVCLYTSEDLAANASVSVIEWMKMDGEDGSETLVKGTIRIHSKELCVSTYRDEPKFKNGFDSKSMVCAEDAFNTEDPCHLADSGGPVQTPLGDDYECMWTQVAIMSIGSVFCGSTIPSIYTKVSHFLPWIQRIVWPDHS